MGLFASDDSKDYAEFQEARKEFKEENKSMRFAIHRKTVDPKNIPFDRVHTTIYEGVGLGEDWRVEKSEDADELQQASGGFRKVTNKFNGMEEKQESGSILSILRRLFRI